jgi:hypothetical protein
MQNRYPLPLRGLPLKVGELSKAKSTQSIWKIDEVN